MKLDISGYFMSIDKRRLYDCIRLFLELRYEQDGLPMLLYLLRETIFNRPEKNCIRKVPRYRWKGLPQNKSLFGSDGRKGLPIGNLTSQLLALLYLDELDHLITGIWKVPHFGRYVDDMVLVHSSPKRLLEVRELIKKWLSARELMLHPRKMYLQHYSKGVTFVGGVIKPGRKYITRRTIGRLFAKVHYYNTVLETAGAVGEKFIEDMCATMNSYLGMMKHYESKRLFHRTLRHVSPEWYRHATFVSRGNSYKLSPRGSLMIGVEAL